jgi:hypothetical protein
MQNLRDWAVKQQILATDLQGFKDRHDAVYPLSFSGNVKVAGGMLHGMHVHVPDVAVIPSPPEIRRVRVVEVNVATSPFVQLVKDIDPTTNESIGTTFPVVSIGKHTSADTFYVLRPANRPTALPTYTAVDEDPAPILWTELPPPGLRRVILETDGGTAGDASTQASFTYKVIDPWTLATLATGISPEERPWPRKATAAERGILEITEAGDITLLYAFERASKGSC